jgi:hypothetical protein
MRAEEDRLAGAAVCVQPAIDVPARRAHLLPRIVLVGLEREGREVVEHAVGDSPFFARRARQRRQLDEEREDVWCPLRSAH